MLLLAGCSAIGNHIKHLPIGVPLLLAPRCSGSCRRPVGHHRHSDEELGCNLCRTLPGNEVPSLDHDELSPQPASQTGGVPQLGDEVVLAVHQQDGETSRSDDFDVPIIQPVRPHRIEVSLKRIQVSSAKVDAESRISMKAILTFSPSGCWRPFFSEDDTYSSTRMSFTNRPSSL